MFSKILEFFTRRSLKGLLLWWIVGAGTIFALTFVVISSLLLNLGLIMKIKGEAERLVTSYMSQIEIDPSIPPPQDDYFRLYFSIEEIPSAVKELFKPEDYYHESFDFFVDIDYNTNQDTPSDDFKEICEGQKCQVLFFYVYRMPEGQWIYLLTGIEITEAEDRERDTIQVIALYVAIFIIFLFSMLALMLFRRISRPVEDISNWASELNTDNFNTELPSFRYSELNVVAEKLKEAFCRTAEATEKERRFLQYASHELRTPIAVASGNIELLEKLSALDSLTPKALSAYERIKYSVVDMRLLTETLLWLNREDAISPPKENVDLLQICRNSIEDNSYLLEGKSVSIDLNGDAVFVSEPPVFCTILIANLIRNAFQHTQSGGVEIVLAENSLAILNWESDKGTVVNSSDQVGFGLGLDLVEQIADRLGWYYHCEITRGGRECLLRFTPL